MLNYHSIETFGAHEGPGLRLVVFLQGCQFKCLYCHNPDTIECKKNKEISAEEVIQRLENGREYYFPKGGITFSGGEPTLQSAEILEIFKQAKKLGYNTCLDSAMSLANVEKSKVEECMNGDGLGLLIADSLRTSIDLCILVFPPSLPKTNIN